MSDEKAHTRQEDDIAGKRLLGSVEDDDVVFPNNTTKRFLLLAFVIFVYFFSYGTSVPVISFYVFDKVSSRYPYNLSSSSPCIIGNSTDLNSTAENIVQKAVANKYLMLNLVWLLPSLIPILFLGPFIDRSGRKKALLIPMAGTLMKQIVVIVVVRLSLPVDLLAIANFLEGICGGFGTVLMIAFGMVADLTPRGKTRTLRITVIETCNAISVSISTVSIGIWLRNHDSYKSPVYFHAIIVGIVLSIFVITVTCLFVRETLQRKVSSSWCEAVKNVRKCFTFYTTDTDDRRRWKILVGISVFILVMSVNFSHQDVLSMFLMRRPLCWHELHVTAFMSVYIFASSLVSLVTLKIVQRWLNLEDRHVALAGSVSSMLSMLILAFAWEDWLVYMSSVVGLLIRVIIPMTRSVMSSVVRQDEQGALFAGMGCIEITFPVVMGSLSTLLYKATEQIRVGVVFLVLSGVMFVVLILYIFLNIRISRQHRHGYQAIN
ncbi:proton-coupled folate transporter-like [Gigantopelta aegis]|uniref:proton-coupled folate transporter-like n=1 Tax=Gigantopelta aegis TaxID=1735272 RepID=UPI001B88BE8C|nr:proton-coupled folate transporter-like [Gigantopelta aegis]XP_041354254.1 proton-coupled folate transporter-like [Gigantopelta aegis]XP_041354255.1 proton-coupled folate transporter-like [Gigantopelta aegis]